MSLFKLERKEIIRFLSIAIIIICFIFLLLFIEGIKKGKFFILFDNSLLSREISSKNAASRLTAWGDFILTLHFWSLWLHDYLFIILRIFNFFKLSFALDLDIFQTRHYSLFRGLVFIIMFDWQNCNAVLLCIFYFVEIYHHVLEVESVAVAHGHFILSEDLIKLLGI